MFKQTNTHPLNQKNPTMKISVLFVALSFCLLTAKAQVPADNTNEQLSLLCKTWGYVKYFNQHRCGVPWDDLLNGSINQIIGSGSNTVFNEVIMDMLNQVGNNIPLTDYPVMPDTNMLLNTDWTSDPRFSTEVRDFLTTFSSNIHPDRLDCPARYNDGTSAAAYGYLDFTKDPFTLDIDYNIESHRLTVMFYYWNLINYFFPYRNLMDQTWDATLLEFIPIFRNCKNETEFHTNFLKLVTHINDSHGSTSSPIIVNSLWKGSYMPKIFFERIENQCVVSKIAEIEGIVRGDILTAIDGIPLPELEDSLSHYIPASNPAAMYRNIYIQMMRGAQLSDITLTLLNAQGQTYTTTIKRTTLTTDWSAFKSDPGLASSYMITSCGYGYVNMGILLPEEVPAMYAALKDAPAIIFDIRNYPKGALWNLVTYLFKAPFKNVIFYSPALARPPYSYYLPGWYYMSSTLNELGNWNTPDPYSGKVYILVNQESQSHAEYTCQSLSYHPNSKVFGTQTAGADGNVTRIQLPGGIYSYFTALGTYYADGYQQQRNGVKIDSVVAPTIQGIRQGRDEILLAALDCLSGIGETSLAPLMVSVYPNPAAASGTVKLSFTLKAGSVITLSLFDITGKSILEDRSTCPAGSQTIDLDLNGVAAGFYHLKIQSDDESAYTKLIVR